MRPIDGTKVKEFFTCPRVPYFSFHRSKEDELPATERAKVFFRVGNRIERELMARFEPEVVSFRPGDFEAGHRSTLELVASKVPAITNGVLKLGEFLGRPDLLLFNEAEDCYEVADIKSTMKTKTSARMQIAFYARMLSQVATPSQRGHVILRDGSRDTFELAEIESSLKRVLETLQSMRKPASRAFDPGPLWHEHCLDCRWQEICRFEMQASDAFERVPGLTRAERDALRSAGIETVEQLADESSVAEIATRLEWPVDQMRAINLRARAVRDERSFRVRPLRRELFEAKFALGALYSERLTEPHVAVAGYLFDAPEKFRVRPLRRPEVADPAATLRDFLANLLRSTGPVVVFGSDVMRALESAAHAHGIEFDPTELRARFIDIRAELRRTFALHSFDSTPSLAARTLGVADAAFHSIHDDGIEVAALCALEGEPGNDGLPALEALLRRDLALVAAIRSHLAQEPSS